MWGHVITDDISRIWFLKSEYFNEFKSCSLVYVPFEGMLENDIRNFKRLFEILGVDFTRIQAINQPIQFEKIILPDQSFYLNHVNSLRECTVEYKETIEQIRNFSLKNRTPTSNSKIYYFHGRKGQFGEERLAEYFQSKGYEIIRPELLTLDEQLNLLINCSSFAATLGSVSHNSIFLREGTEAIFIPRSSSSNSSYQNTLNQVHELDVKYIDSSLSIYYVNLTTFCYIVSPQLKRFFGEECTGYDEEDLKTFLYYNKKCIDWGMAPKLEQVKGYGKILTNLIAQLTQRKDLIAAYNMPLHWDDFKPTLTYQTHIHKKGWSTWALEDSINGYPDEKVDIQAIKIRFPNYKVYYSVYYNEEEGWTPEVSSDEQAGTTGQSKSIFGIKIYLDEAGSKSFNILYRMHKFDGTWTDWAKNGEAIYSYGQKLNAIQIKLETKGK